MAKPRKTFEAIPAEDGGSVWMWPTNRAVDVNAQRVSRLRLGSSMLGAKHLGAPAMSEHEQAGVLVAALTHDLRRKRSIVHLAWMNDPEKNVALPVPFGCSLDDVRDEAEKALRALSAETATLAVTL